MGYVPLEGPVLLGPMGYTGHTGPTGLTGPSGHYGTWAAAHPADDAPRYRPEYNPQYHENKPSPEYELMKSITNAATSGIALRRLMFWRWKTIQYGGRSYLVPR